MQAISKVIEEKIMPRERTVSTSIRVPEKKYFVLEELKRIEDKPINALVVEAIDCLIAKKADILEEKMIDRTAMVKEVLDELKK